MIEQSQSSYLKSGYIYLYPLDILLIYSRAILSFAWLAGYAMRPVLLSDTVHTDSFTAHNNIASWEGLSIVFSRDQPSSSTTRWKEGSLTVNPRQALPCFFLFE